jgi:hypothetical protein
MQRSCDVSSLTPPRVLEEEEEEEAEATGATTTTPASDDTEGSASAAPAPAPSGVGAGRTPQPSEGRAPSEVCCHDSGPLLLLSASRPGRPKLLTDVLYRPMLAFVRSLFRRRAPRRPCGSDGSCFGPLPRGLSSDSAPHAIHSSLPAAFKRTASKHQTGRQCLPAFGEGMPCRTPPGVRGSALP